jgi:hypothetical protein
MKIYALCAAILIYFLCQGIWTEAVADVLAFQCHRLCRTCVNPHAGRCSTCGDTDASQDCGKLVNCHLKHRGDHCDGYDGFHWNATLASDAQQWANKCTHGAKTATNQTGFAHCNAVTPNECQGQGENLFTWYGKDGQGRPVIPPPIPSPKEVIDGQYGWYPEVQYMELDPQTHSYKEPHNGQVNGHTVGHFTQMVWASTTSVGCGHATCPDPDHGQVTLYVCRYSPAGNIPGQFGPPDNNVVPPQCYDSGPNGAYDRLCP